MGRGFEGYPWESSESLCPSLCHPIAAENSATKVCTVSAWAMRADSCSRTTSRVAAYIAAMSSAGYGTILRGGHSSGGRPESMVLRSSAGSFTRPSTSACLAVNSWFRSKASLSWDSPRRSTRSLCLSVWSRSAFRDTAWQNAPAAMTTPHTAIPREGRRQVPLRIQTACSLALRVCAHGRTAQVGGQGR